MEHISSTISERVLRFLETEIIEARLAPGQRLTEEQIAGQLGVSRSPVREALRKLEHVGLVSVVRRKGAVVRPLDAQGAADLYVLHACVTGLIGRLAARNRSQRDIADFEALVSELRLALEHEDPTKFLSLYPQVMRVLTRAAGNGWIENALDLWEKPARRYGFVALSIPGYMEDVVARYEQVLEALKARDAPKAEEVLRSSHEVGGQKLARFLNEARATQAKPSRRGVVSRKRRGAPVRTGRRGTARTLGPKT
jgi:DNA-binding GntR family transcriptional regulator